MEKIISIIREIHKDSWKVGSDVSKSTRSAQSITKEWQNLVKDDDGLIKKEEPIFKGSSSKIDIVDLHSKTAYELKVSGKNPHHEFYKDLMKIIQYNFHNCSPLETIVFITECKGICLLKRRFKDDFQKYIECKHNIKIKFVCIPDKNNNCFEGCESRDFN